MNLKNIINFEINTLLKEIKNKFNLNYFISIKDIEQQIDYLDENLTQLGKGSSRFVYLLNNQTVIKIINPSNLSAALAQNKTEVLLSQNNKINSILTKIYKWADDYSWVIAELVTPLKSPEEFEKLTGVSASSFTYIISDIEEDNFDLKNTIIRYEEELKDYTPSMKSYYEAIKNAIKLIKTDNKFIKTVILLIKETSLLPEDVTLYEHWGKTADGKIVLFDYGLTKHIHKKYY